MTTRILRNAGACSLLAVAGACANSVAPPAPLRVVIVPSSVTMGVGATVFLSAVVNDSGGGAIVPDSMRWTSSDTVKATVSTTGVLVALRGTTAAAPTVTVQATAFRGRARGSGTIPVMIPSF